MTDTTSSGSVPLAPKKKRVPQLPPHLRRNPSSKQPMAAPHGPQSATSSSSERESNQPAQAPAPGAAPLSPDVTVIEHPEWGERSSSMLFSPLMQSTLRQGGPISMPPWARNPRLVAYEEKPSVQSVLGPAARIPPRSPSSTPPQRTSPEPSTHASPAEPSAQTSPLLEPVPFRPSIPRSYRSGTAPLPALPRGSSPEPVSRAGVVASDAAAGQHTEPGADGDDAAGSGSVVNEDLLAAVVMHQPPVARAEAAVTADAANVGSASRYCSATSTFEEEVTALRVEARDTLDSVITPADGLDGTLEAAPVPVSPCAATRTPLAPVTSSTSPKRTTPAPKTPSHGPAPPPPPPPLPAAHGRQAPPTACPPAPPLPSQPATAAAGGFAVTADALAAQRSNLRSQGAPKDAAETTPPPAASHRRFTSVDLQNVIGKLKPAPATPPPQPQPSKTPVSNSHAQLLARAQAVRASVLGRGASDSDDDSAW